MLRRLAGAVAVWTPYAVLYTLQQVVVLRARGDHAPLSRLLIQQVVFFGPWALATPFVLELGERFPLSRRRFAGPLAIHLAATTVIAAIHCVAIVAIQSPKDFPAAVRAWVACMTGGLLLLDAFIYFTVSIAGVALRLRQKHRDRERDVARLEVQLAQARLRNMESQLHPHFAFNALNTVAMLIREHRNDVALSTLVAFSDLLRQLLARGAPLVPLSSELDSIRRYLDIEGMRFGDRLRVTFDVTREALPVTVPSLLLQPLVENSIRHGASLREGPFHLVIRGHAEDHRLRLTVEDDGPGLPPAWSLESSPGFGLRTTHERLRQVYGDDACIALGPGAASGLRVTIDIPQHTDAAMMNA